MNFLQSVKKLITTKQTMKRCDNCFKRNIPKKSNRIMCVECEEQILHFMKQQEQEFVSYTKTEQYNYRTKNGKRLTEKLL